MEVVADAGHGAALGHDVAEVLQHLVNFLFLHRVGITALDAGDLAGDAVVHVIRRELVDVAVAVLQGIFVGPDITSQCVAMEVFLCGGFYLIQGVGVVFDFRLFLCDRFCYRGVVPFHYLYLILAFDLFGCKRGVFARFNDLVVWCGFRLHGFRLLESTK